MTDRVMLSVILILVCLTSAFCVPDSNETRSVHVHISRPTACTSEGCLFGTKERGNIHSYDAFYGIPYAAPPVGHLRFKKPQPPATYPRIRDCTYPRRMCMQQDIKTKEIQGSENCLYLNIYRPRTLSSGPLPVLVYLHGGAFKFGSTHPSVIGADYLMDSQRVILVTVAFRLGVFGFLSSGDKYSKGNFGLKDQVMALDWIQRNIQQFNGDPSAVTLMSESSGSAQVHLHMMSEKSNGLFHKGIMIGGTGLSFWTMERDPQRQLRQFASIAGIPNANTADTRDIVGELCEMSAEDLVRYSGQMYQFHDLMPTFRPVVEKDWSSAFINRDPQLVWKRGDFAHRPFLSVVAGYEQGNWADFYYDKKKRQRILDDFDNSLMAAGGICRNQLAPIKKYYFDDNPCEANVQNYTVFIRDRWFLYPFYSLIKQYTAYQDEEQSPMDLMVFNFTSKYSTSSMFHKYTRPEKGASKNDIMLYLFSSPVLKHVFRRGQAERDATKVMVGLITDYMRFGFRNTREYPQCTAEVIRRDGFCHYLLLERRFNEVHLTTSNSFDLGSVKALSGLD